ncbi:MAG: hypothetical protein MR640_04960, partial [Subdoligranulum sp.]|nr:hypothetical protein [Subdoligranulum sp.]
CPCFGSLFPPLAALTFAASSIICAFGLASAAPRSPYRHLELCGIAIKTSIRNPFFQHNKRSRELLHFFYNKNAGGTLDYGCNAKQGYGER